MRPVMTLPSVVAILCGGIVLLAVPGGPALPDFRLGYWHRLAADLLRRGTAVGLPLLVLGVGLILWPVFPTIEETSWTRPRPALSFGLLVGVGTLAMVLLLVTTLAMVLLLASVVVMVRGDGTRLLAKRGPGNLTGRFQSLPGCRPGGPSPVLLPCEMSSVGYQPAETRTIGRCRKRSARPSPFRSLHTALYFLEKPLEGGFRGSANAPLLRYEPAMINDKHNCPGSLGSLVHSTKLSSSPIPSGQFEPVLRQYVSGFFGGHTDLDAVITLLVEVSRGPKERRPKKCGTDEEHGYGEQRPRFRYSHSLSLVRSLTSRPVCASRRVRIGFLCFAGLPSTLPSRPLCTRR